MEIILTLKQHCIKTAAKRRYEQLINKCFSNKCSDHEKMLIEPEIEALRFFLDNADFVRLRGIYPELSGFNELPITLLIPDNQHEMKIIYNGKIIKPEWIIDV
mmetsp:Transcript_4917/g.2744  ORF Transcript_4917/g.2744 Transcript_4917/m.2744 type:complete len:103 (+) Transcript_4917:8612-8920(+)